MNTKTEQISSGLVAMAEVGSGFSLRWTEPDYGGSCSPYDKLVRLADAEAIISKQAERIKGMETELETERLRLAGCGVAALGYFDGCKQEYKSASLDDVLRLLEKHNKQAAALKLAKEVLEDAHQNINPERGYADEIESDIEKTIAAINEVLGE